MSIVNRRNAVLGWLAWKVGKGAVKKKAKGAVPGSSGSSSKRKPAVFAGIAAAAVGAAAVVKRRHKDGDEPDE
jgi:hypothetical protein